MNEENKRYNPGGGAIHPEHTYTERNTVPGNSKEILRRRLLQKIEEKKRLLNLTKTMSGAPASEGGMSREKANKTVQLLNEDISNLENELRELESDSKNLKTTNNSGSSFLKPLDDDTKSLVFKRLEENKVIEDAESVKDKIAGIDRIITILHEMYKNREINKNKYLDTLASFNREKGELNEKLIRLRLKSDENTTKQPFHIDNLSEEINNTVINSSPKVEDWSAPLKVDR